MCAHPTSPHEHSHPQLTHVQGLTYLQTADYTPTCTLPSVVASHPERPMTLYRGPHSLFRALAPKYRLNKAEYLQLYNLRPASTVVLDLVIEEVRQMMRLVNWSGKGGVGLIGGMGIGAWV